MWPFKAKQKESADYHTKHWHDMLNRLIYLKMSKETFGQLDVSNEDYLDCYAIAIVHNKELANDVDKLTVFLQSCQRLTDKNGKMLQHNAIDLLQALKALNNGSVKFKTRVKKL